MILQNPALSMPDSFPPRPVLFITRKWHGRGGMQCLSRDLDRELSALYGARYSCVRPRSPGLPGFALFVPRALAAGIRCGRSGGYVHLGDAALLPLGAVIARLSNAILSVTACGLDVLYPSAVYQWLLRRSIGAARRIACISEATAEAVRLAGAESSRVIVIPCGIRAGAYAESGTRDMQCILSVGRLMPRKGMAWFIEHVMPELMYNRPGIRLIIAGSGPEEVRIRRLITENNLAAHVQLITDCDDTARDALLAHAGVFIMPVLPAPGDMEGFGIVCIEAAAAGLQVCAARIGGVQGAVLEGETGRFFEPGDVRGCVMTILQMMEAPLRSADVARATRERFAWSTLIDRYHTHVFF